MSAAENGRKGNEEGEEMSQEKLQQLQDLVQKMDRAETRLWSSIARLHNLEATLTVLQEAETLILEVNERLEKKIINRNDNRSCTDTSSSKINLKDINKSKNINHVYDISSGDKICCPIKTSTKSNYKSRSTTKSKNCIENKFREDTKNILSGNYKQSNPHTSSKNNIERFSKNSSNNNDNYTIKRPIDMHRPVNNNKSKSRENSRKKHKCKYYKHSRDYRETKHKYRHSKSKDITTSNSSDTIKFCNKGVQLLGSVGASNPCINPKEKSFAVCQMETSKSSEKNSNKQHLGNVSNLYNPYVEIEFCQTSDKANKISKKAGHSLDLIKNEQKTAKENDALMYKLVGQEKEETFSKPNVANHRRKYENQLSEMLKVQDFQTPVKTTKEAFSTSRIVNYGIKCEEPKVQTSKPPLQKIEEISSSPCTANGGIKPSERTEKHNFKPQMKRKKEYSSTSASNSVKCEKPSEQPDIQNSNHLIKRKNESSPSPSSAYHGNKCEKLPEEAEIQSSKHPMKRNNESPSISASISVKCEKPPEQPDVQSSNHLIKRKNESLLFPSSVYRDIKCEKPPEEPEAQSSKHSENRKQGKRKKPADDHVDGLPIPILMNGRRFATASSVKGILMYPPAWQKHPDSRAGTDYEMRGSHIPFEIPVYPYDACTIQTNFSGPSSFPLPGYSANSATTRTPLVPLTNILFPEHFSSSENNH
ncbi:Protein of unknown function [Gryllus bimaculatus]|nr:Protein of unknown function [Gryllus bimaculatus]